MIEKHLWLYVLELEQGKWYVGISTNVPKRYQQHVKGFASAAWTKKYKPIRIHDTKDLGICSIDRAELFEGRVTREYMEKYGDNNVRGGDLTQTGDYVHRLGHIWLKEDWRVITTVSILCTVILLLVIDKYL